MKKTQAILCGIITALFTLAFTACPNSVESPSTPPQETTTGSITGWALFTHGEDNGGIIITLEETSGPRSASVIRASLGTAAGARGAGASPVVAITQTNADGSFDFGNIPPGTYTLHASSRDSLERAVATSLTVKANEVSNAGTLKLTPVGSISGQITVDDHGAMGFIVSVAGTSLMAVTGDDGAFTIGGVPAGSHSIIVVRGNFTAFFAQTANMSGGTDTELYPKNITGTALGNAPRIGPNGNWWVGSRDLGVRAQGPQGEIPHIGSNGNWWIGYKDLGVWAQGSTGVSIVWMGELAAAPSNPQPNWAYFNTVYRNAFFWNGTRWDTLAERGEAGNDGEAGIAIVWLGEFDSHAHPDLAKPQMNWAYHNTTNSRSYIFDGEAWRILARDGPIGFVPVEGVSLNRNSLGLSVGQIETLMATVYPADATIDVVLWNSSRPDIASIDMFTGKITTHRDGDVTITAITLNGNKTANASLNVRLGLPSLHLSIEPFERGGPHALHRTIWRPTTVSLHGDGIYEVFSFEGVNAEARGRGNASWANSAKRPLRIRFLSGEARPMFGSSYAARDWTLIANALEHSMMRNYAAYFLGASLSGIDFSPTGHFLHLYMDGEYRGVYMLSDQMHVHEGRVELTSNPDPTQSEYFLEWCFRVPSENEPYAYFVIGYMSYTIGFPSGNEVQGVPFSIRFPGGSVLRQNLGYRDFAKNFITRVHTTLAGGDFEEISKIIDIPSFIDFYLVQELFQNMDVGVSSVFFQIRQMEDSGPRLFAGPLWDFDRSSGFTCWGTISPEIIWAAERNHFFRLLMATDEFRRKVGVRWNQIRDNEVAEMILQISYLSHKYQTCFEHNFYRWPDPPERNATPLHIMNLPFMEQVDYLINWLEQRKLWMDEFLR